VLPGQECVRTQVVAFERTAACVRCSGARTTANASPRCVRSCVGAGFDRKCGRTHITAHGARLKRCTIGPARATREMRADWTCVRPEVPCVRTQITARAGWACVRPLLLRATVGAFERTKCVRTHLAGISFFTWCILPFASHVLMQCPAQHKILKTLKIIRY
jgi:hypothetical protein